VNCVAGTDAKGERVWLHFRVLDGEGQPLDDALLELWQANSEGKYQHPDDTQEKPVEPRWHGFGRIATDENGSCVFQTVKPGCIPGPDDSVQAPHINVSVFARGILKRLATRIYFRGNAANATDPVMALVPETRRDTLVAQPDSSNEGHWFFEVHLCGEKETVFFDI
jgi:protocatechuate 3,4-dioxygenase alpha subunit